MELYFTRHARNRMRFYGIEEKEVEETLREADETVTGAEGRRYVWRKRRLGGWLRVTFKEEGSRVVIITVTPKREFSGGTYAH